MIHSLNNSQTEMKRKAKEEMEKNENYSKFNSRLCSRDLVRRIFEPAACLFCVM